METNSSTYLLFFTIIMAHIVFSVIANMMLFDKLGKKKWLAIVPFVSEYIIIKSFMNKKAFWIFMPSYIVYLICCNLESNVLVSILYLISLVIVSIIIVDLYNKILQSFGANTLYSFGLILLYPVFMIHIMYKYELTDEMKNKLSIKNQ